MKIILIQTFKIFFTFCIFFYSTNSIAESRLRTILETGQIRVGTTGDWNPMTIKDPSTNEYKGFEIEIVNTSVKTTNDTTINVSTDYVITTTS